MRNEPRLQPFAPGAGTPPPEVAGFAKSLTLKFAEIEVGLEFDPEPGLVDRLMEATYDVVAGAPEIRDSSYGLWPRQCPLCRIRRRP